MALAPNFPTDPYVYVLYTYDHELGRAPRRRAGGRPGSTPTGAPLRPARPPTAAWSAGACHACRPRGNVMTGGEQVLVEDWCQQYPSHSIGTVEFGADGKLYASGGDGASFNFVDYGQDGNPLNPCGDPPGGVGATLTPAHRRGRGAAQPGPAHQRRPGLPGREHHPGRPGHRRRPGGQPAGQQPRRERPADHRLRAAQPVPLHVPPGHQRALGRRRRLEHLGGDQPHH